MVGNQLSDMDYSNINEDIVDRAMKTTAPISDHFETSVMIVRALNQGGSTLDLGHIKN